MRVLLVEDNLKLVRSLTLGLNEAGMVLDVVNDGVHADQVLQVEVYDVVVLDLALPRMDGLEVLHRMRTRGNDVPVLILTASGDTADRVQGLNAGADDYLPKPFDLSELVARLRAIARRRVGRANAVFTVGRLSYDTVALTFSIDGTLVQLPPREHGVLAALVALSGRPVSKVALCNQLCSLDDAISPEAIEIYIHRLRKRLDHSGTRIRTMRGLGYMLEAADVAPA
jgi:two-component system response regulator TctD